ncbi:hypothetical protein N9973_02225, partial [bacterium]|nr:hypothetical protein [bacterium]
IAELTDLHHAAPLRTIHAERKAENHGLDFALSDNFYDAGNSALFSRINGLDRVRTDPEFIRGREADAGLTMIDC